ncbi:MAG: methionyl-tRNA formyltransferase [Rickettsiales bacterium]|jgi:methionyl-tRNA formyltransferase|nr:methionyl-tRNA formyltransferase [Rickettsiales bacterium]
MKLVLMGTNEWTVPVFERAAAEHEIIAVFTRAPKPAGRKMIPQKSPVHIWAEARGLPVHTNIKEFDIPCPPSSPQAATLPPQRGGDIAPSFNPIRRDVPPPERGGSARSAVGGGIDFIVVASYGVILHDDVLNAAPIINLHPSLLPKYRGPSPMLTAILNGDARTGVCLMDVVPEVDAGDIHMTREIEIGKNDTVVDLEARVSSVSADMLSQYLKNPAAFPPRPQIGTPTFTRKFTPADTVIDWNKTPLEIHNQIRSIGGRTKINGMDAKVLETRVVGDKLEILRVQPAGKNPMDWKSFVNGQRGEIKIGE